MSRYLAVRRIAWLDLRRLTSGSLFCRDRPDNEIAAPNTAKRYTRPLSGDRQKSVNFWLLEHFSGREADETGLFAPSREELWQDRANWRRE